MRENMKVGRREIICARQKKITLVDSLVKLPLGRIVRKAGGGRIK